MEKASRALRRSSAKLLSIGGGNSDLNVMISEVKDMRSNAKAFMNAQNAASQDMSRWAASEENRAIQDVVNQISELNMTWTDVQRDFLEHLKEYRQMLEMVLEGEKHVLQAKNNFAACDQRATKLKKELKKSAKKATAEEIRVLENKLSQAERTKDLAQMEVCDRLRENEAVKLIRLKEGLVRVSEAYVEMGKKCATVFEAQRDVVLEIPDVHGKDLEDIKYTGSGTTQLYVHQAREKIREYKRQSFRFSLPSSQTHHFDQAPPPYCTSDEYLNRSQNSDNSGLNSSQDQSHDRSHDISQDMSHDQSYSRLYPSPHLNNNTDINHGNESYDLSAAMGAAKLD